MAEDSKSLFKLLLAIGVLILFVNSAAPGSFTAWNTLQERLTRGIETPTFNDPFSVQSLFITRIPNGGGAFDSGTGTQVGCESDALWECVNHDDGDRSYINLTQDELLFGVNVTDAPATPVDQVISFISIRIVCRMTEDVPGTWIQPAGLIVQDSLGLVCPVGDTFQKSEMTFNKNTDGSRWEWSDFPPALTKINIEMVKLSDNDASIHITFMSLDIYSSNDPQIECGNDPGWFGIDACQIGRAIDTFLNGILFVFNGIIFVVQSIVAVLSFMATVNLAFLNLILQITAYFIALPGAPAPIQSFIAILFVSILGYVMYLIVKLVRGSE